MRTGSKDAFGNGLGNAHQFGLAMGERGITPAMFQQAVADPGRGAAVAASLRGDSMTRILREDLLSREIEIVRIFCEIAGIVPNGIDVSNEQIEQAILKIEAQNGSVKVSDRFMPGNLTLFEMFRFIYNWNAKQIDAHQSSLKLYNEQGKEWWRSNKDVESIPTKPGIITCDFQTVIKPTDMLGRPFNLGINDQIAWANDQGGDGIMSAEEVVYLFVRSLIENQLPLWGGGSIRCRNAYGSGLLLDVGWSADRGFSVGSFGRSVQHWALGALPRKSLVLVP